jgi:MFS family permease
VVAGGLVSLYLWGRVVDRVGVEPVFRVSSLGLAALYLSLVAVNEPGALVLVGVVGFFFAHSVLSAGFGVADTRVLFELTPPEAPARTLVITGVIQSALVGPAPMIAGFALDALLARAEAPLAVYHVFFVLAAVAQALAFLPLRVFRNPISAPGAPTPPASPDSRV